MGLLELIEHRSFRVRTHTRSAQLVDRPALGEQLAIDLDHFNLRFLKHFLRRLCHVFGHFFLVIAKFIMEPQRRNAPIVLYVGIDIDVVFVSRKYLAKSAHLDVGSGVIAHLLLIRLTESGCAEHAAREHAIAARALETVTANEIRLAVGQIAKTR